MKYESPKSNNGVEFSPESSSNSKFRFVPKGLSKRAYEVIETLNNQRNCVCPSANIYIKDMTKEEVFAFSKELSDYNIGKVRFPYCTDNLEVSLMKTADDYATVYRLLKYPLNYEAFELSEDISNMAKEGYKMVKYAYIPEGECYAAKFVKD